MKKPPEQIAFNRQQLNALFPFHIQITQTESLQLQAIGALLTQKTPHNWYGKAFHELFEIERPLLDSYTIESINRIAGRLVRISSKFDSLKLRGQFVMLSQRDAIFLGTLNVQTANCIQNAGLELSQFPPSDLSPDLVILQRIREMQLNELNAQNTALAQATAQRDELNHFANTDSLTKIPNRRGFLSGAVEMLAKSPRSRFVVVLLDVDNFKSINDNFGHLAGDTVLVEVAGRLSKTFSQKAVIGRWGGDEFVLLLDTSDIKFYESELRKKLFKLGKPVTCDDTDLSISLSCGAVRATADQPLENTLHQADMAMYEGRRTGHGFLYWFDDSLQRTVDLHDEITKRLPQAIKTHEFEPHYQAIYDIQQNRLRGFEALARWYPQGMGAVSPLDFLTVAENNNLLPEFDRMMLDQVVEQLARWHADYPDLSVHINLSAPSFRDDLPLQLTNLMHRHAIPHDRLVLELTESSLLVATDKVHRILDSLSLAGFPLSLDDFGTGYSSLTHLREFPVEEIKIDRQFVNTALKHPQSYNLLAGIVDIAKRLDLFIVAEGVESQQQLDMLNELQCNAVQGYYISRPIPAEDCDQLLLDHQLTDVDLRPAA